jgi:CheY-like chemotaxis protein
LPRGTDAPGETIDAGDHGSTDEFLDDELPAVPSCIILDVRLPGINGLDFQASLHQRGIFLPVILMTGYGDIQMSVRGMKAATASISTSPSARQPPEISRVGPGNSVWKKGNHGDAASEICNLLSRMLSRSRFWCFSEDQ